jgi:hypothetical protein
MLVFDAALSSMILAIDIVVSPWLDDGTAVGFRLVERLLRSPA